MSTDFGSLINSELDKPSISNAEFVRVTVYNPLGDSIVGTKYAFSTSYKQETFGGDDFTSSFTPLGGLVNVSGHQRDLTATAFDTQITLVGIDQTQIGRILEVGWNGNVPQTYHAGLKGSKIEIWRGFYNDQYTLVDTPALRYTGIVTSYHITEDRQGQVDTFTLTLNCSSFKTVFENKLNGRQTNGRSWNKNNINATTHNPYMPDYDSNGNPQNVEYDSSMDRVAAIHNTAFSFGVSTK